MISQRRSPGQDTSGAVWQLVVGLALCGGAMYLLYLINRWTARGVHGYLKDLFLLLNEYGGKWVVAGLVAALGVAFCFAAVRRLRTVPDLQPFPEGTMLLESARWMNGTERDAPARSSLPAAKG